MREIKFRAWDKHKKMFIPTEVWAVVTTDFNAFGVMIKDWDNYKEGEYFYSNSQELSQFTGLRDRNGREIYEGDIVRVDDSVWNPIDGYKDGVYKVEYCLPDCAFCLVQLDEKSAMFFNEVMEYEVIGNIYENPELLNNQ